MWSMKSIPIIILTIAVMGAITTSHQFVFAQPNNTLTGSNSATNYTKLFSENKDFQECLDFMPDQCFPTVEILYQSPNTVALKSEYIDAVWKAVDTIKKDGYKIDDITSYSITSGLGSSSSNIVNLLVVMSK